MVALIKYLRTSEDRKAQTRGSAFKWILLVTLFLGTVALLAAVAYEMQVSKFQAQQISRYAAMLSYSLKAGPSDAVVYPRGGPFDKRLGYSQLPQLLNRLRARGMKIESQTRFSPSLVEYASRGFFTPYREKLQAGLKIADCQGESVYQFPYPKRVYASFDTVPPLIVQSLLFVENRKLLDPAKPYMNPAVDWVRFARAVLHEAAKSVGLSYQRMGGSTLATQIEKYRHSPRGFTTNRGEKLRQMVSASVRAYQGGPKTLPARRQLVLTYLNSVPLGAAAGYGEVHGIGDGLWVWFGEDINHVNQLLRLPKAKGDTLSAQGLALRQVVSLMIAQRRPYYYLRPEGRAQLSALTGSYLRLMAQSGYISAALRDASLSREVTFRDFSKNPPVIPKEIDKGILMVRTHLSELLDVPLYDLDRFDLAVTTTLQKDLQKQVSAYLDRLSDPEFAGTTGLFGEHLLTPNHTRQMRYSFILYESTPQGNMVRVQADNTDQPFDINEGSKLELGSTAKLRVFVQYLEVIAEIHKRYVNQPPSALLKALSKPQDNLSRWVLEYMIREKDTSLPALLQAATERRYSASPWEVFFTGGGMHTFHNFQSQDNRSNPTVREALLRSINLPFIRLMRDLVRYSTYQTAGSTVELFANDRDPRRRVYLARFADREGRMYLRRFWHKYDHKSPDERLNILLRGLRQNPVRLAAVHRYLYPETDSVSFAKLLHERLPYARLTDHRIMELYHRYGPEAYTLSDQGYIAGVHPLELWLLDYLRKHPEARWTEVVEASQNQRQQVYAWLLRTQYKHARDSRIRTMLELDAFEDIQQRWKRLGYPFNHLVPSYATALGSSGDRPAALAELMGIIINKGVRQQKVRIEQLHFAANTPYETIVKLSPVAGQQVMIPEVAAAVQEALSGVVETGTARRLKGSFSDVNGDTLPMGGKTGTGDNRLVTVNAGGQRLTSRAVNRTATFVFFLGENHFGTLTAFVPGRDAADYSFTSALPIQVLLGMAPILQPYLVSGSETLEHDKEVVRSVQADAEQPQSAAVAPR
ncbi:penicillin-binding protein [Hymenobacter jejuensis]|uniref:peptidoglycan glycosyltransferase n=2 Tax=Hymenobacter jejuensis TaxID=2502781 RepID=A0A5B8A6U8_9BACT|nr:penicillin-binding protein [Hymenobacter jejuensis]